MQHKPLDVSTVHRSFALAPLSRSAENGSLMKNARTPFGNPRAQS